MPPPARLAPLLSIAALLAACGVTGGPSAPDGGMSFFVTSTGSGRGGNLGGLAGADAHCARLAAAVGSTDRTWRAYLSTAPAAGSPPVHARDRIGGGPWLNAVGDVIAGTVAELHGANNLNRATALTERGGAVPGLFDSPRRHAILTGSNPEGRALSGTEDRSCGNWTSSDTGAAIFGHHDRQGPSGEPAARSWNAAGITRGCSPQALAGSGSAGLFYCFAVR